MHNYVILFSIIIDFFFYAAFPIVFSETYKFKHFSFLFKSS